MKGEYVYNVHAAMYFFTLFTHASHDTSQLRGYTHQWYPEVMLS